MLTNRPANIIEDTRTEEEKLRDKEEKAKQNAIFEENVCLNYTLRIIMYITIQALKNHCILDQRKNTSFGPWNFIFMKSKKKGKVFILIW